MKIYKILISLVCCCIAIFLSSSCERDDICAENTQTTPMLIIKFIEDGTVSDIRQPNELQVQAIGFDSIINFTTNQDSIMIPLRTNASLTDFVFTINSDVTEGDTAVPNADTLSFQYTVVEDFLSSACGFIANYNGLTSSSASDDDDEWIDNIIIEEENVINETVAHVLIFH